jgi:hypothetical protein
MTRFYKSLLALVVAVTLSAFSDAAEASDKYVGRCNLVFEADSTLDRFMGDMTNVPLIAVVTDAPLEAAQLIKAASRSNNRTVPGQVAICGITKKCHPATLHPEAITEGCEFELETELSLRACFRIHESSGIRPVGGA